MIAGGKLLSGAADTTVSTPFAIVATSSYYCLVRAVGIKTLKNKLSEYVRLAQGGETVLVTDRDRVVAELVPPSAGRSAYVGT